jgi:hypothetical protein
VEGKEAYHRTHCRSSLHWGGDHLCLSAWTTPGAIVSVYDGTGTQEVNFGGKEILGSPESLMAWGEAMDAATVIDVQSVTAEFTSLTSHLDFDSRAASDTSYDFVQTNSSFNIISDVEDSDSNTESSEFERNPVETAMEECLQKAQPYPGDDHVQEESRFLVYETAEYHIVMDNMTDRDTILPSNHFHDPDFDVVAWYAAEMCAALGLNSNSEDGALGTPGDVHALATDTSRSMW